MTRYFYSYYRYFEAISSFLLVESTPIFFDNYSYSFNYCIWISDLSSDPTSFIILSALLFSSLSSSCFFFFYRLCISSSAWFSFICYILMLWFIFCMALIIFLLYLPSEGSYNIKSLFMGGNILSWDLSLASVVLLRCSIKLVLILFLQLNF
jgi:hypothetical protein